MAETRLETAVRKFLYSSEEAKIVLETLVTSSDSVGSPGNLDDQDKRVLAVITHRDRLDGHEEGR
jgi:hypothetical protein